MGPSWCVSPPSGPVLIPIGSVPRGIFVSLARPRLQPGILPLIFLRLLVSGTPTQVLPLPLPSGRINHFAAWIHPHTLMLSLRTIPYGLFHNRRELEGPLCAAGIIYMNSILSLNDRSAALSVNPGEKQHPLLQLGLCSWGWRWRLFILTPRIAVLHCSSLSFCSTLQCLGALADEAVFKNFSERGLNVSQGLTLEGQVYPVLESWAPWSGNPGLDFAWAIAVTQSRRASPNCSSF